MQFSRRNILKIGVAASMISYLTPIIFAQNSQNKFSLASAAPEISIDGNISYNAGWVIPLEDKPALLDLESKKTKEREDLAKKKTGASSSEAANINAESKSFGKRFQDGLAKLKNWF